MRYSTAGLSLPAEPRESGTVSRETIIQSESTRVTLRPSHLDARLGGLAFIVASIGFMAVFSWLAAHFGYPEVLDRAASDVLPKLLSLGAIGRTVWIIYALLPLLLIPASIGAATAFRGDKRNELATRVAVVLGTMAAIAMTIGLARWSTAQWSLAGSWVGAGATEQTSIASTFNALNLYLGNVVGEFLGELALYGSFAAFSVAAWRNGWRWTAGFGAITATSGWIGMFRNITPVAMTASSVTNVLLPIYLIALGIALMRQGNAVRAE